MSYELKHRTNKRVTKGMEYPLGATLHGDGVNFAVYSKHASEVFLLLFDKSDGEPTDIFKKLANRDKFIWHEFARTQRGNNNAYCQDNEIRWFDWTSAGRNSDIFDFFRIAIAFTRPFPILQHRKFFLGVDLDDDQVPDLSWFAPDLGRPQWHDPNARTLCYQLDASEDGAQLGVSRLFFILNADFEPRWVKLPSLESGRGWHRAIDTSLAAGEDFAESGQEIPVDSPDHYIANPRSTVVLLAQQPAFASRSAAAISIT